MRQFLITANYPPAIKCLLMLYSNVYEIQGSLIVFCCKYIMNILKNTVFFLLHMHFRLFKTTILPTVRANNIKRLPGKYAFKSIFAGVDIVSH